MKLAGLRGPSWPREVKVCLLFSPFYLFWSLLSVRFSGEGKLLSSGSACTVFIHSYPALPLQKEICQKIAKLINSLLKGRKGSKDPFLHPS